MRLGSVVTAGFMLTAALAVLPLQAAAWGSNEHMMVSLFTEQGDKAESSGFSLALRRVERNDLYMQAGISYQRITLKATPAGYADGRVRPVFIYGRVGMDWWLSPYIQAGLDINDSLFYWLNSADDNCCHVMAKTGLEVKLHDNLRLELYGNWYSLRYQTGYEPAMFPDYQDRTHYSRFSRTTLGAQLSLVF